MLFISYGFQGCRSLHYDQKQWNDITNNETEVISLTTDYEKNQGTAIKIPKKKYKEVI